MADIIKVRRDNRIIRVTPNELEKYLVRGYKVVNEVSQPSTEVVEEPTVKTPKTKATRRKK